MASRVAVLTGETDCSLNTEWRIACVPLWRADECDRIRLRFGDSVTISDLESMGLVVGDVGVSETVWLEKKLETLGNKILDFPDVQNGAFVVSHKFQYAASKFQEKRLRPYHGIDRDNWHQKVSRREAGHARGRTRAHGWHTTSKHKWHATARPRG